MVNHVYGNKKQNQEDNDQAERPLKTPGVRAMESQIAGKRPMLSAGLESLDAGEAKKTRVAILAAIWSDKEKPQEETLPQPMANRDTDSGGTAIRTFHGTYTLS
jgi:hypothetical protein